MEYLWPIISILLFCAAVTWVACEGTRPEGTRTSHFLIAFAVMLITALIAGGA